MTADRAVLAAVGARIRAARKAAGMSVKTLCGLIDAAPSSISMYEHGNRDPGIAGLLRIAEAIGVTAASLLGEADGPQPDQMLAYAEDREAGTLAAEDDAFLAAVGEAGREAGVL